jgi:hypothetical protein
MASNSLPLRNHPCASKGRRFTVLYGGGRFSCDTPNRAEEQPITKHKFRKKLDMRILFLIKAIVILRRDFCNKISEPVQQEFVCHRESTHCKTQAFLSNKCIFFKENVDFFAQNAMFDQMILQT